MQQRQPIINPHRFTRIVIWAKALLAWLALLLFSDVSRRPNRRHIRQRYGFISLACIERLIGALAIVRATELANAPCIKRPPPRNAAPPGFRRRAWGAGARRAILGGRLRKALKHREPRHFERLLAALSDIDAFARRYLLKRVRRRFTKRRAVVMAAPPAYAIASLAAAVPGAADTS
jgi:hypothetical protein